VAPEHINHNDFVRTMARVMGKPVFLPPVPAWILRAVIGKMSDIVLKGSRISAEKIINIGYSFRFDKLDNALKNVIRG
jgi:NAD dependent epimerase/dehydratase family enzyme